MDKLSVKQKAFADLYMVTGNATQSYIDAGYSATTRAVAEANGRRLLVNDKVSHYIQKLSKEVTNENIADMIEVREFWTETMRASHVERKDRLKASEYIAKTNGAFLDRTEHSGNVDVVIVDDIE